MTSSQPREPAAGRRRRAQARRGGIGDLSLRELAAAIGTSHRMLLYHFGFTGGPAVTAVARAVEEAERPLPASLGGHPGRRRGHPGSGSRSATPRLRPAERLFFELYVQSLLGRPGTEGFARDAVTSWAGPVAEALEEAGADPATARAEARLGVAVVRGLLLDLLATGDHDGVRAAHEQFLRHYQADNSH